MWPVQLSVDTTITRLAPCDLTADSPLRFLEAQWMHDPHGAWGVRVLYATPDRLTHYAWEPHLDLLPGDAPLGAGLGTNAPAEFRRGVFEMGEDGITIDVDLTDVAGHRVVWTARQSRPWAGFDFLAPPAAGIQTPNSLFFPYLRRFSFVPQPLEFTASFDGTPARLQKLPFPWNWRRAVALKGALGSVIVELLRDGADPLKADDPGARLDGSGRLASVTRDEGVLPVVLQFNPPLPPVDAVTEPVDVRWRIVVGTDPTMGGTVRLRPGEAGVDVAWTVERGWAGVPDRGFAWWLTRAIPMLTKWPLNYSWTGRLTGEGQLEGRWTNAKPVT